METFFPNLLKAKITTFNGTRRYGPLHGPTSRASALFRGLFHPSDQKKAFYAVFAHLKPFLCSVVPLATCNSNPNNFQTPIFVNKITKLKKILS